MSDIHQIAFLCHPYHRGGVTSWMADAAVGYKRRGYEVYFITVDPVKPFHSGKDREKMIALLKSRSKDIKMVSASVNYTFEFGTENSRAAVYKQLIEKHVPKGVPVIVSDDGAVWQAIAAIADNYPMIGVLHGDQEYYYARAEQYQTQLSICACVSNRIRNKAAERCKQLDPRKIFTIPCGIDMPVFDASATHDNVLRLIFIGRLSDYEKRATDLIKIGAKLHKNGVPFHLDIAGNSESSQQEFTQSFKKHGVDSFVSFHGWRSKAEIHTLLNGSDILLLTSNSEGMPIVMMEALASGCGFTGTRVSGIEDYENNQLAADCISVYTTGDIDDAANKINRIAAIPVSIRRQAARKLAVSEFSMDVCLDKYTNAIAAIKAEKLSPKIISLSPLQVLYSMAMAFARYVKVSIKQ